LSKWLFVATPENWQRCLEKRTWGVKERYKTALQRIKTGDQILIHLTENKTAGICKVVREYFEDISIMWEGDEIYQHRIGIEPLKAIRLMPKTLMISTYEQSMGVLGVISEMPYGQSQMMNF
jgi:predicted RNA-binding protein